MTKKDYELIAEVLRNCKKFGNRGDGSLVYSVELEDDFATALSYTNPNFDRPRFLAACFGEDSTDSAGRTVKYSRS